MRLIIPIKFAFIWSLSCKIVSKILFTWLKVVLLNYHLSFDSLPDAFKYLCRSVYMPYSLKQDHICYNWICKQPKIRIKQNVLEFKDCLILRLLVLKPCLDLMMSFKNCIRIRIASFCHPAYYFWRLRRCQTSVSRPCALSGVVYSLSNIDYNLRMWNKYFDTEWVQYILK